jgi:chemotaxis protein CheD
MAPETIETSMVGMGQIAVVRNSSRLSAVLGSCIGVALYHPRLHLGAMGHVVLPRANGQAATPGKFADTAVPYILQLLLREGANVGGLVAKIAGGACMFGNNGPLQIGQANAEAVEAALTAAGIRLVARDVGGNKGRRVMFDAATGSLSVETAGGTPKVL